MKKTIILLALTLSPLSNAQTLSDFSTDGCSMYRENKVEVKDDSWYHCCVIHDIDYWMGGAKNDRYQSDLRLKACVKKVSPFNASIMYRGVRAGGRPGTGLPWQWGYGFSKNIGYRELSLKNYQRVYRQFPTILDALLEIKDKFEVSQKEAIISRFWNKYETVARSADISPLRFEQDHLEAVEKAQDFIQE